VKQIPIDALLETPRDDVTFQKEWTTHGQQGWRAIYLEIALFAGAVGPGLFVVGAMFGSTLGLAVGYLIVLAGYGLPHLLFLGRVERFWRGMLRPGKSWISRGFLFANLFMFFGLLAVAHVLPALRQGPLDPAHGAYRIILWIATGSAVLLAVYPGFLFATIRAIPFWQSAVLVPLFLIQGLGGGVALSLLLSAAEGSTHLRLGILVPLDIELLALGAILIGAHLYLSGRSSAVGKTSVDQLLGGSFRRLFLVGAALVGLACPLALLVLAWLIGAAWPALPAGVFQLVGILLFKYCLLNVGAYSPLFDRRLLG
jgi:formate-dependent nitrite reductase membrane component NrfD